MALIMMIMDIQQSCFSGVMLAVGRLVGIEKTIVSTRESHDMRQQTALFSSAYSLHTSARPILD